MNSIYDVVVVGAGPAGCRTAELVSKRGFKTALIEKRSEIGQPVQCAGLISHRLKSIIPDLPKNIILNKINHAKFFTPKTEFELESKRPFYVVDREQLDKLLFFKARKAGVETHKSTAFNDFELKRGPVIKKTESGEIMREDAMIVHTLTDKIQTKLLVGADGPISNVASKAGLMRPSNVLTGAQATVRGEFAENTVELFFDYNLTPDFFGWVVPLSAKEARIGVAARNNNIVASLKNLIHNRTNGGVHKSSIKPDVAGRINFGLMKRTSAERVMVVGDAAAQVKPFSGGGVVYGLIGAGHCANACIKSLSSNNFSADFLEREYDRKWKSQLGSPIKRGLMMRRFTSGSERKMNFVLEMASRFKFILQGFDADML